MAAETNVIGFRFKPSQDGESVVLTVNQGQQEVRLGFPVEMVGKMAAGLLGTAAACGGGVAIAVGQKPADVYVMACGVGSSDVPNRPDAFALTFGFGQTQLSGGLSRQAFSPLGTAMMAASADNHREFASPARVSISTGCPSPESRSISRPRPRGSSSLNCKPIMRSTTPTAGTRSQSARAICCSSICPRARSCG